MAKKRYVREQIDLEFDDHHRNVWGDQLYATDIDYPLWEYTKEGGEFKLCALIEYKKNTARQPDKDSAQMMILTHIANHIGIPFFVAMYNPHKFTKFLVFPMNEIALKAIPDADGKFMDELAFVNALYKLRGYKRLPDFVEEKIKKRQEDEQKPPEATLF